MISSCERRPRLRRLQQLLHGRRPGQVEELLVHRVEQPAQGGDRQHEPVIPIQQREPRTVVVQVFALGLWRLSKPCMRFPRCGLVRPRSVSCPAGSYKGLRDCEYLPRLLGRVGQARARKCEKPPVIRIASAEPRGIRRGRRMFAVPRGSAARVYIRGNAMPLARELDPPYGFCPATSSARCITRRIFPLRSCGCRRPCSRG